MAHWLIAICGRTVGVLVNNERKDAGQDTRPPVLDSYGRLSRVPEAGELEKIDTQWADNRKVVDRVGACPGGELTDGLSAWKRSVRRPGWQRLLERGGVGRVGWHRLAHRLGALMSWSWLLDKVEDLLRDGESLSRDVIEDLENAKDDAIRAYASVLVVADGDARTEIEYGFFDHLDIRSSYTKFAKYNEKNFMKVREAQSRVRRRARDELGIQPITDPDPMP